MPHPGRDVPVDRAEVIPLLVGPHLRELDALAAEHGAIVPGEEGVDESPGAELDPLDLPEDLGSDCPAARPDRGRRGPRRPRPSDPPARPPPPGSSPSP